MSKAKFLFLVAFILILQIESFAQKSISDTTFISRDTSGGIYHAIFIEKNKDSQFYNWLTGFQFSHNDSTFYGESIRDISEKQKIALHKNKIPANFPRQWCQLNNYKNNFYLYIPSDYGNNDNLIVSDTTVVRYFMDGPYACALDSFIVIDANTFELQISGVYSTIKTITVHMIDWKKQTAVFDNHNDNEKYRYTLMVGAAKAKEFPIVVNYCNEEKQSEFDFDAIDFGKLLKPKSK